ncbi:MAG: pectate lyase [Prolixibacteraceae bacterium]|nr:pectate lyase [Prolixibacteraceae bacterium]
MLFFSGVLSMPALSQPLAFPGAEGCGRYATGGRGGNVVFVSNLNDSGPGSLRYALKECDGPRMILFKISGTIYLKSEIEVTEGNFTLAGQSAPGDGICVAGNGIDIEADNVIIRYLRLRPGDIDHAETDALTIKRSNNVIVDHCSMSWSTDETCSCYDNTNFTLQWCILSESLNNSVHHKGEHGYGGIWGGMNASFHHNLLAHHTSRNPRLHGSRYHKMPEREKAEIVNNVIYNWRMKCIYGGEEGTYTITGNYFKPGPATTSKKAKRILEPWKPFSTYFFQQNTLHENPELSNNNSLLIYKYQIPEKYLTNTPLQISNIQPEKAKTAFKNVLKHAGASFVRDEIDKRIVNEVKRGTAKFGKKGIIDSQEQVGSWPELKSDSLPADSDNDGMPDEWEINNNLDPENPEDGKIIRKENGYSNLEIYLNSPRNFGAKNSNNLK